MISSALPRRAGVGFKPEHFADILSEPQPLGFFEVHAVLGGEAEETA